MLKLKGFRDADNFHTDVISGYYYSPGNSYANKFVNSLRLEDKYKNDDDYNELAKKYQITKKSEQTITEYFARKNITNEDDYEYNDFSFGFLRSKKGQIQNANNKQTKKKNNKIKKNRLARNDNKMFNINQCILKPSQLLDKKELENENWYLEHVNIDLKDHSNDYKRFYDSDDDYEERQLECWIEYARDHC